MNHLTVKEMIDFVSFNKPDNESMKLMSKVNSHIFRCDVCRKKIETLQFAYDELTEMGKEDEIDTVIKKCGAKEKKESVDYKKNEKVKENKKFLEI